MTGMLPKLTRGTWRYPKTKAMIAAAGLHTITHYVQVHRVFIMQWVVNRPILELCKLAERRCRTIPHTLWQEQPIVLDEAIAGAPADVTSKEDGDGGRRTP